MFRDYRNCMLRSEWLKDAKFKSLVANDRTERSQRQAESESSLSLVSVTVNVSDNDSDSDTDSGSDIDFAVRMSELRFLFVTL